MPGDPLTAAPSPSLAVAARHPVAGSRHQRQAAHRRRRPRSAQIFMVNPVQSSGDQSLTDQKDPASAVPSPGRTPRCRCATWTAPATCAASGPTSSPRPARRRTRARSVRLHPRPGPVRAGDGLLLGQPGPGVPAVARLRLDPAGIVKEPFSVKINQYGGDNSYQTDKPYRIRLGKGGVDDAEDAEVIVHEYGHAVHQSQVPGFGQSARRRRRSARRSATTSP